MAGRSAAPAGSWRLLRAKSTEMPPRGWPATYGRHQFLWTLEIPKHLGSQHQGRRKLQVTSVPTSTPPAPPVPNSTHSGTPSWAVPKLLIANDREGVTDLVTPSPACPDHRYSHPDSPRKEEEASFFFAITIEVVPCLHTHIAEAFGSLNQSDGLRLL